MNVIQFKLPDGFQPKAKIYRRRKISRCMWISPDTLFTLCEVVLRKLLMPAVPRRKFWPTVISLVPSETARSSLWHQVQCPWDFNRQQRTVVNYANHWALLSTSVQHRNPTASNIRIGSLVRNKITQLLLDLDYCSSSGSDGGMPQGFHHPIRFESSAQYPFEQEEELTEQFVARSAAENMRASSAELYPEGSRCNCCCNCGHRSDCSQTAITTDKEQVIQQLIVMGRGTTRGSCQVQINDSTPCGCCQARM